MALSPDSLQILNRLLPEFWVRIDDNVRLRGISLRSIMAHGVLEHSIAKVVVDIHHNPIIVRDCMAFAEGRAYPPCVEEDSASDPRGTGNLMSLQTKTLITLTRTGEVKE